MSYKNVDGFGRALFLWNDARSAILVHGDIRQDRIGHPAAYFIDSVTKTPLCVTVTSTVMEVRPTLTILA